MTHATRSRWQCRSMGHLIKKRQSRSLCPKCDRGEGIGATRMVTLQPPNSGGYSRCKVWAFRNTPGAITLHTPQNWGLGALTLRISGYTTLRYNQHSQSRHYRLSITDPPKRQDAGGPNAARRRSPGGVRSRRDRGLCGGAHRRAERRCRDRTAAFIRAQLRTWGIISTAERFDALVSLPGEARLSLARRDAPVPALTLPYSPATPTGGLVAELRATTRTKRRTPT